MDRYLDTHEKRRFLLIGACVAIAGLTLGLATGCRSGQYGHLLAAQDVDLVGSHEAGAATWNPLVDSSVAQLLGRCPPVGETIPGTFAAIPDDLGGTPAQTVSHVAPPPATGMARVCFVGIENKSAEEMVDFKDQLYERIDSQINHSQSFRCISRRMVDAALIQTRMRPDQLFMPGNRDLFAATLGKLGAPVDHLLFATITSGTTDRNRSTQRDYVLTLEMVNLHTGDFVKESAKIRKGYHKTRAGKWWNFGIFDQADG